jgi:hypothetical protein
MKDKENIKLIVIEKPLFKTEIIEIKRGARIE